MRVIRRYKISCVLSILFVITSIVLMHGCGAGITSREAVAIEEGTEGGTEEGTGVSVVEENGIPIAKNINVNLRKVISTETGEKKIIGATISFETEKESAVILKIDGDEYSSQGRFHFFTVTERAPNSSLEYSIVVDGQFEGVHILNGEDEYGDEGCDMFWSVGDISPYLSVFGPITKSITDELGSYCGKLYVYLFTGLNDKEIFDKNVIFTLDEQTPEEMFASIEVQYQKHEKELMEAWPILSKEELMVAFVFNVVGNMWHFGNYIHPEAPGCVTINEEIGPEVGDYIDFYASDGTPIYYKEAWYDMPFFLKSRIGCCTDHAYISKLLLNAAGYTARRLVSPGHWFAEAIIDGRWNTIDATYGVITKSAIEDMANADEKTAYVFILPYMEQGRPDMFPYGPAYSLSVGWTMPITDEFVYIYYRHHPGE